MSKLVGTGIFRPEKVSGVRPRPPILKQKSNLFSIWFHEKRLNQTKRGKEFENCRVRKKKREKLRERDEEKTIRDEKVTKRGRKTY